MVRRIGAVTDAHGVHVGDHICWAYSTDEEHREVLISYFQEGLRAGQRIAYFAPRGEQSRLLDYLDGAGEDPAALLQDGRLVLSPAEDAYRPGGSFDAEARLESYRVMVWDAFDQGYPALRVAGEGAWLLDDPEIRVQWLTYELRADLLATKMPFMALCCYDLRECGEDAAAMMNAVHSLNLPPSTGTASFQVHGLPDGSIAVRGEVDFFSSDLLRRLLIGAAVEVGRPCLDLSGLRFADINGVRAIAAAAEKIAQGSGSVEIRGMPSTFLAVWRLLRFDESIPATLSDAALVGGGV